MNTKLIFLLMLALGCGTLAAVAGTQLMNSQQAKMPQVAMTEILVASDNLAHGAKITGDCFKAEKWPSDRIPKGAVTSLKEVEGKYTNQPLYAGEPLLDRKIINSVDFVSTKIPVGYKVFDMPIGDSDYIRPGDHVDVFGYFEKSSKISQTRSLRVLQNVTVLMVDGIAVREMEDAAKRTARTAQLLIKDSQYEALTTAANLGKLRMALCGLNVNEQADSETDNGEEFLSWVENSVRGQDAPTAGAMPFQPEKMVSAPAEQQPAKEQHSMVVYSGGIAHEYRWHDNEMPVEVGGSASKAPATAAAAQSNSTPPGKFTGTNTVWDPTNREWTESDFNSAPPEADSILETQ